MEFDRIYESMNGMLEEADPNYPSEFEEGMECWSLYESIFDARIRLSKAINGNEDGDHPDIMIIINAYEQMMRYLCKKRLNMESTRCKLAICGAPPIDV